MKINCELTIDYVNDDYTINEAFKEELQNAVRNEAAKTLAANDFRSIYNDKVLDELKREYEEELRLLKEKLYKQRRDDLQAIENTIKDVLAEFIAGEAFIVDKWGVPQEKITVKEFLLKEITPTQI